MPWYSYAAIFFVLWWIVLFAVLPFGVRSQPEEETLLGTDRGAPSRFRFGRKMLATTVVTIAIFAVYYVLTAVFGLSFDDIPSIIPTFQ